MRLLRRLEKNHDGIRSAATRQHYIQIYQAMKYLSLDVADFIEKGPQLAELPAAIPAHSLGTSALHVGSYQFMSII
jgi:hypothetical protein